MIDTHCHPQFPQYDPDRDEVIKHALDGGVKMICIGTDLETSKQAVELAKKHDGIWATVGLHPNDNLNEVFDSEAYYKLGQNEKVIGIGEIGLDYYRTPEKEKQNVQKKRFLQLIQVASDLELPIVIHCRDAYDDLIELLKTSYLKPKAVVHSFTGNWEQAQKFLELGFYIGLNGIVTFTDQYNEVVKNTPLDRILLETDAPFLAPVPHRGKRNEPLFVKLVAEHVAKLRGIDQKDLEHDTTNNAMKLFNFLK